MQTKKEYDAFMKMLEIEIRNLEAQKKKIIRMIDRLIARTERTKAKHIARHKNREWMNE